MIKLIADLIQQRIDELMRQLAELERWIRICDPDDEERMEYFRQQAERTRLDIGRYIAALKWFYASTK